MQLTGKITPETLMSLEAYTKWRKVHKPEVIAHRKLRTVHLGEHVSVQFEDEKTSRRQIQEMLHIEKIFDEEGNGKIGWTVPVDDAVQPKVGGEGYLAWMPKKKQIVAIIGNDAVVFDPKSEKLGAWVIQDGTPNAVEVGDVVFSLRADIPRHTEADFLTTKPLVVTCA